MTEDSYPNADRVSREASGWMIRLQEEPDNAGLRREFKAWLSDPGHAAAWADTERMTHAVRETASVFAGSWGPHLARMRKDADSPVELASVQRPRRRALRAAGLAAAACLVVYVAASVVGPASTADLTTATAEIRTVQLADSSRITLAPNSAVDFDQTDTERRLRLISGEIYLDVAPHTDRPFRIDTGTLSSTVLGTAFNVYRGDTMSEVGVAHGIVKVAPTVSGSAGSLAVDLTAGRFVRVGASGRVVEGKLPVSQIGAWRNRQLIAHDMRLGDVMERLRPYYGGVVLVMDDTLGDETVTGVYDLSNPVDAIRAIARSQKAVVRQVTPWLVVVSRR